MNELPLGELRRSQKAALVPIELTPQFDTQTYAYSCHVASYVAQVKFVLVPRSPNPNPNPHPNPHPHPNPNYTLHWSSLSRFNAHRPTRFQLSQRCYNPVVAIQCSSSMCSNLTPTLTLILILTLTLTLTLTLALTGRVCRGPPLFTRVYRDEAHIY